MPIRYMRHLSKSSIQRCLAAFPQRAQAATCRAFIDTELPERRAGDKEKCSALICNLNRSGANTIAVCRIYGIPSRLNAAITFDANNSRCGWTQLGAILNSKAQC